MLAQIAEITDSLYLSAANPVQVLRLQSKGITQVINCTMEIDPLKSPHIKTVRFMVADRPYADLGIHFEKVSSLIENEKRNGGKTLVHCVSGCSRSATLCIAYLMKCCNMDLRKAYYHVRGKRPIIYPNVGFFKQLILFERHIYNKNSVKMVSSPIGLVPDVYLDGM